MKIVKALPFLAMGTMTLGLVGATVLAPVANADNQNSATQTVKLVVPKEIGNGFTNDSDVSKPASTEIKNGGENTTHGANVTCTGNVACRVTLADEDDDTALRLDGDKTAEGVETAADLSKVAKGWNVTVSTKKNSAATADAKNYAMVKKGASILVLETKQEDMKLIDRAIASTSFNFKTDKTVAPGTYTDKVVYTTTAADVK